jgi:hypothetical protein
LARDEHNVKAKLTEAEVVEIRRRAQSESPTALAKEHGVGVNAVSKLVLRKTWRHVE